MTSSRAVPSRLPDPAVAHVVIRLRELRRQLEYSTADVARECYVPEFVVRKVEQGEIDPTVTFLSDYARFLGLALVVQLGPVDDVLGPPGVADGCQNC